MCVLQIMNRVNTFLDVVEVIKDLPIAATSSYIRRENCESLIDKKLDDCVEGWLILHLSPAMNIYHHWKPFALTTLWHIKK